MKTEHAGAKNGGGHWGTRAEAKALSRVRRRADDKLASSDVDDEDRLLAKGLTVLAFPIAPAACRARAT